MTIQVYQPRGIDSALKMKIRPLIPPATSDGTLRAFTKPMTPPITMMTPKIRK